MVTELEGKILSRYLFVWRCLFGIILSCTIVGSSMSGADQAPASGDKSSEGVESGVINVKDIIQIAPLTFDPLLLALGRRIYSNLQRARQAVLDRNSTLLEVAIDEVRDDLTLLR